ncbi:hypothetical protein ACVWW4_004200 [Bradyrhizobium sp. LB7.1]
MTPNFRSVGCVANPTGCKRRSARFGALATELKAGAELGSLLARQRFGPHLKLQQLRGRRVHSGAYRRRFLSHRVRSNHKSVFVNEFSGAGSRGGCWRRSRVNIEHLGGKCDVPSASYQAAIIRRRGVLLRPPARSCLPRYLFKPSVSSCDSWPKARPIYRDSRRGGGIRYELSLANLGWLGRSHRDDADDPRRRPAIRLSPLSSPKQRSKSLHSVQTGAVHITRPSSSHSVR